MIFKSKNDVLSFLTDKDDKMLISSIYDRLYRSYEKNYSDYSDFLDNRQISLVKKLFAFLGDSLFFAGGFENSERSLVAIFNEYCEVPVKVIEIKGLENVSHRDVLGALMSLGIKRQKIGDIIVGDKVYIAIKDEVLTYVIENLKKIKNYNVEPKLSENKTVKKQQEFIDIEATVSSLRLDSVISSSVHLAREKSKELILSGRVSLNHFEITDNKKTINQGDIISIKGIGRFVLSEIKGTTKKDRIKITVSKYK